MNHLKSSEYIAKADRLLEEARRAENSDIRRGLCIRAAQYKNKARVLKDMKK